MAATTADFDLVVRGGTVADGTGGALRAADIGVKDGLIAAIGASLGRGAEEINANGLLVTPGFIDVHTHYDGQAVWDERLEPSTQHGATTVVMGNCGVGFAPCRAGDRDALVSLMEGVEDIPGAVITEGLDWRWESFADYLGVLANRRFDADVAVFVPHGPVRVFAMGERAIAREAATEADIALMRQLVADGVAAGAVGFSTSRTLAHRTAAGALVPTYQAAHAELIGIGAGLKAHPGAVFQMISDWDDPAAEFAALEQIVADNGARGTFTLVQNDFRPGLWADVLARVEASDAHIRPQVIARPIGVLMGLSASMHTFSFRPSYQAIAHLSPSEKAKALKNPELRAKILSESDENPHVFIKALGSRVERFFRLTSAPDYLPAPEASLGAEAQRLGRDPFELVYDALLEDDGAALIYLPLTNYTDPTGDVIETMLRHEKTLPALGDGGAHVGTICDASVSTYFLKEWVTRRGAFALEEAVRRLSAAPADFFGFTDRGRIAPGLRADLNVIDLDALAIERPSLRYDLPAGGKRFLQGARGYRATVCAGAITRRDDAGTEALPGRLVRRGARRTSLAS